MSEFASADLTAGQLNALVKIVGGKERVLEILRGTVKLVVQVAEVVKDIFLKALGLIAVIPATDGKRTFAGSGELFSGYLDLDFVNYGLSKPGQAKPETKFEPFELVKSGTFKQFIGSLGVPLDKLVVTEDQAIWVVENRPDLLNRDGAANFFLLKEGDEYFVANVYWHTDGRRGADVNRFGSDNVWRGGGEHRLIVPQQTPAAI